MLPLNFMEGEGVYELMVFGQLECSHHHGEHQLQGRKRHTSNKADLQCVNKTAITKHRSPPSHMLPSHVITFRTGIEIHCSTDTKC